MPYDNTKNQHRKKITQRDLPCGIQGQCKHPGAYQNHCGICGPMARLGIAKISIKAHDGHEYCDKHLRQCVDCEPPLHQRGTCNEDCANERYTLVFLLPAIIADAEEELICGQEKYH